jgi:ATP-binding cassette subfamily C protein LapB
VLSARTDPRCIALLLQRLAMRHGVRISPAEIAEQWATHIACTVSALRSSASAGHESGQIGRSAGCTADRLRRVPGEQQLHAAAQALSACGLGARVQRFTPPAFQAAFSHQSTLVLLADGDIALVSRAARSRWHLEFAGGGVLVLDALPGSVLALALIGSGQAALEDDQAGIVRRTLRWLGDDRRRVGALLAALLLAQAASLAAPAVTYVITDRALPDGARGLLLIAVLALAMTAVHSAMAGLWRDRLLRTLSIQVQVRSTAWVMQRLLRLPYAEAATRTVGDCLQTRASAQRVANTYFSSWLGPAIGLPTATIAWIGVYALLPGAALAVAGAALLMLALCVPLARTTASWQALETQARGAQQSLLLEVLSGAFTLRATGAARSGARRWLRRLVDEQTATLGQVRNGLWLDVLFEGTHRLVGLALLIWSAHACVRGELGLGACLAAAMLADTALRGAIDCGHALIALQVLQPHRARVDALAAQAQAPDPPAAGRPLRTAPTDPRVHALTFDSVSFRYPGATRCAIEDYCLSVPAGTWLSFHGQSGAGKTTMLRLASGLLEPAEGRVRIFGRPVRDAADLVAYLPQDATLFEGTIESNLQWIAQTARVDIIAAARATGLDAWIRTLPMGYATRVPVGAGNLSGGQRQWILVTAALANPRPLLLLDEPVAHIDRLTRRQIFNSGLFRRSGRTVVMISHEQDSTRPSRIGAGDRRLAVDRVAAARPAVTTQ